MLFKCPEIKSLSALFITASLVSRTRLSTPGREIQRWIKVLSLPRSHIPLTGAIPRGMWASTSVSYPYTRQHHIPQVLSNMPVSPGDRGGNGRVSLRW